MMHIGAFDDEYKTIDIMEQFILKNGYQKDLTDKRFHHEIYLSDPRKVPVQKLKTIIRIPIKI